MKKERYIGLIERVLEAYSDERIRNYTERVTENGIEEHGYPRLTANIGILIANGRKMNFKDEFLKMMDICCREIPTALGRNGKGAGNDFSVKEIVFCLLEVEKAGIFDKSVTDGWRKLLSEINPYETYSEIAPVPAVRVGNWAAFGAVSEQLRKYAGIGDESDFIENQIKSQLFSFDENGMYRDPDEPMVYDTVTRLQLALALYFGFDGESRDKLEQELMKSADITLKLQSVTGEIPFGGRSAQFLHNEAHFAALCEYYAGVFKKRGDMNKAGQFKSAAEIAIDAVSTWLHDEKIYHVKNYYDNDSMYGCESYSYFDKYMVTAASMLYAGYVMAEDDIEVTDCPVISENYICRTSDCFHKLILKYGDYFAEFETKANSHYDASGLGRIHKKGAPSALCLSLPFAKEPSYGIDIKNPSYLSICAGVKTKDGMEYTCEPETEYKLTDEIVEKDFVRASFECRTPSGQIINQTCTISAKGVEFEAQSSGEVEILFPVFDFDGLNSTEISVSEKSVTVYYKGYECVYSIDGIIKEGKEIYANRNGHYKTVSAKG
ncbi:MAG: hypothetical protein IKV88_02755, partial [Clostridia bacterium]|nr:hypothetical protein [Clostridia bacterium]